MRFRLFCVLVGVESGVFSVRVDGTDSVGDLKKVIKQENKHELQLIDANKLQLHLTKKGDGWLPDDDPVVQQLQYGFTGGGGSSDANQLKLMVDDGHLLQATMTIAEVLEVNKMTGRHAPRLRQIHVLVVMPRQATKRKRGEIEDNTEYIPVMQAFKVMVSAQIQHVEDKHRNAMNREVNALLFKGFVRRVKTCFDRDFSFLITADELGIRKHHFILYCITQLTSRQHAEEVKTLLPFDLVVIKGGMTRTYEFKNNVFIQAQDEELRTLPRQLRVIQIVSRIDGSPAPPVRGWRGVTLRVTTL